MQKETRDQVFQAEVICWKNTRISLRVDRSAEVIKDWTEAKGGEGNTPEPNHAVEEVLFEVILLFSINGPRNDKTRENKKNNNIVLSILRTYPINLTWKKPMKISMTEEDSYGCRKP
jgi:hypothetical protein